MNFSPILHLGLVIFIFSSCTSSREQSRIEGTYQSTGAYQYFMSEIPAWANFSEASSCRRNPLVRYFDLGKLMKSFSLDYHDALMVQASFNEEFVAIKKNPEFKFSLKEEETLFQKSLQRTQSKINFFDAPAFKKIHLINLDEHLAKDEKAKNDFSKVKNFLQSRENDSGVPILVSSCLSRSEIESFFPESTYKSISVEMFSIFNEEGIMQMKFHFVLASFFKSDQQIVYYSKDKTSNADFIKGKFQRATY